MIYGSRINEKSKKPITSQAKRSFEDIAVNIFQWMPFGEHFPVKADC